MGFKKTTEGRVYFQGDDAAPATKPVEYRSIAQNGTTQQSQSPPSPQATQFQILSLLRALNDKLKLSQAERARMQTELDSYRKTLEDVASRGVGGGGKAERAEKMAQDTLKELHETRKLLLDLEEKTERADKGMLMLQRQVGQTRALGDEMAKRQTSYEDLIKRVTESEKISETLAQKIEETVTQQGRMLRQIEKVAEDRARFMRKIERIEETVIQTRDALSAKAMVLLTEQGANARAEIAAPSLPEQLKRSAATASAEQQPAWRIPALQAAGVAAILALGVFAGWAVTEYQKVDSSTDAALNRAEEIQGLNETSALEEPLTETANADIYESETAALSPQENTGQFSETPAETPAPPEAVEAAPIAATPAPAPTENNDIGAIDLNDTAKLAEMLDKSPDAVAAALNKIEPGAPIPVPAPPATQANAEPVKLAEAPKEIPPPPKNDIKKQMKPDASLPAEARAIEKQAFAGVPEAQHDLAAIYTAGHNGVNQDYERAAYWFRKAADQGVPNARYNLGVLYHQGLGVKADVKEAIRWYQSAAEGGHPEAQYNLGIAYIEGIGVNYDAAKAADNFEKAAKQGIVEAAYNLGLIYENGLLGRPKPDQALKWYKSAADQGSPEAKQALQELAKNLNIRVEDVNRVADTVSTASNAPVDLAPSPVALGDTRSLTTQVQEYLMKEGMFPGPADGAPSAIMADAIRSYQMANNLPADGKVSQDLLRHMLEKPAPAARKTND